MTTTTIDTFAASLPVPATPAPRRQSLFKLLLREHGDLNTQLRDGHALPGLAIRMLTVSITGFVAYGLVMGFAAERLHAQLGFMSLQGHPIIWLPMAFVMSLIGALGICLPIFYICSQMAGLDAPIHVIAAQALRANATGAAFLLGVIPFYVAAALGCMAGLQIDPAIVLEVGFALPFLSGLGGIPSVYSGFKSLADAAENDGRADRRRALVLAMELCATFVYLLVAPLALYRLAGVLGPHF